MLFTRKCGTLPIRRHIRLCQRLACVKTLVRGRGRGGRGVVILRHLH